MTTCRLRSDHKAIADLVNQIHPDRATLLALEAVDHGFFEARSPKDAFDQGAARSPRAFNPVIVESLQTWAERIVSLK